MRRIFNLALVMACICSLSVSAAFAGGPGCSGEKAAKSEGSCSKTCGGQPAGFPAMVMSVNGKTYDCCMSAGKAAKDSNAKIVYLVGDKKLECKDTAMAALADASEQFVDNYTTVACVADGKVMYCKDKASCCAEKGMTVKADGAGCDKSGAKTTAMAKSDSAGCCKSGAKAMAKADDKSCGSKATAAMAKSDGASCDKSGGKAVAMTKEEIASCCKSAKEVKYMLAGRTFKTHNEALKARDKTLESFKNVKMTYVVDGKEVDCSSKICPTAKKDGKVVYVVGKEKMNSEIEARIALAKAKYEAARDFAEKLAKI